MVPDAQNAPWQSPAQLSKLALVWEAYAGDSPQQQVWFDDFALATQRIGCPTPAAAP